MSIERSPVAVSHKPAAGTPASHGKSQEADTADNAGGFSGLMLTLGAADTTDATNAPSATNVSNVSNVTVGDAGVPGAPVPAPDASLLLAQAAQVQPDAQFVDSKVTGPQAGLKRAGATTGLVSDPLKVRDALRPADEPSAQSEALATPQTESEARLAFDAAVKDAQKDAISAHSAGRKAALANDNGKSTQSKLDANGHEQKLKVAERSLSQGALNLPQLSVTAGLTEPGMKQTERAKERLALKQVGDSEAGAWGYQALAEAGRIQAPSEAGASAALTPEMQVAQQVHYWIGRDVQSAELKLDGLGEGTVKVNISMQGNEASVVFQSDQVQTRQILESAAAHLKELLGREGLVLSSVSVGTSGAGGAGARQASPGQPARPARVGVVQAPPVESAARSVRTTGRAVDLFV